ncbi:MAG: phage holin family protein [Candidatus Hydrogenedentes bacterium]|nr:phage holin family protein [Candidatus Hydrogenedentota bacterium]
MFRWIVLALAVWVAAAIVPGIQYDDGQSLLVAALVLSVLNTFVKPALHVLSLPFIVMTLGLFLLVVNALVLMATAWLVPGFHVAGFWPAVGGSLVISVVSFFLGATNRREGKIAIGRVDTGRPFRRGPPPGKGDIIDV